MRTFDIAVGLFVGLLALAAAASAATDYGTAADASIAAQTGSYGYAAHTYGMGAYFKTDSNQPKSVNIVVDGYNFTMDIHTSQLRWYNSTYNAIVGMTQEMNPQATVAAVSGNTITYADAWVGTDLKYEINPMQIKETLVIRAVSPPSSSIRPDYLQYVSNNYYDSNLKVCANGNCYLHPSNVQFTTQGTIVFQAPNGTVMFYLSAPYAYDSAGSRANGTYAVTANNGILLITIRIPRSFLDSAVFPVYFDPTVDTVGTNAVAYTVGNNLDSAMKITASANGVLDSVGYNIINHDGNVIMGIYSDNAGVPDVRLGFSAVAAVVEDWNDLAIGGSVNIVMGTNYWVVASFSSATVQCYKDGVTTVRHYRMHNYDGTLINPWDNDANEAHTLNARMTYSPAVSKNDTTMECLMNGTAANHTYAQYGIANFTAASNVTALPFNMTSTYLYYANQTGSSPLLYYLNLTLPSYGNMLSCNYSGNGTYNPSNATYYFNVTAAGGGGAAASNETMVVLYENTHVMVKETCIDTMNMSRYYSYTSATNDSSVKVYSFNQTYNCSHGCVNDKCAGTEASTDISLMWMVLTSGFVLLSVSIFLGIPSGGVNPSETSGDRFVGVFNVRALARYLFFFVGFMFVYLAMGMARGASSVYGAAPGTSSSVDTVIMVCTWTLIIFFFAFMIEMTFSVIEWLGRMGKIKKDDKWGGRKI